MLLHSIVYIRNLKVSPLYNTASSQSVFRLLQSSKESGVPALRGSPSRTEWPRRPHLVGAQAASPLDRAEPGKRGRHDDSGNSVQPIVMQSLDTTLLGNHTTPHAKYSRDETISNADRRILITLASTRDGTLNAHTTRLD